MNKNLPEVKSDKLELSFFFTGKLKGISQEKVTVRLVRDKVDQHHDWNPQRPVEGFADKDC